MFKIGKKPEFYLKKNSSSSPDIFRRVDSWLVWPLVSLQTQVHQPKKGKMNLEVWKSTDFYWHHNLSEFEQSQSLSYFEATQFYVIHCKETGYKKRPKAHFDAFSKYIIFSLGRGYMLNFSPYFSGLLKKFIRLNLMAIGIKSFIWSFTHVLSCHSAEDDRSRHSLWVPLSPQGWIRAALKSNTGSGMFKHAVVDVFPD